MGTKVLDSKVRTYTLLSRAWLSTPSLGYPEACVDTGCLFLAQEGTGVAGPTWPRDLFRLTAAVPAHTPAPFAPKGAALAG